MSILINIILLLLGGMAVFIFGNPYYDIFPTNGSPLYLAVLTAIFLLSAFLLQRSPGKKALGQAAYALAAASAASLLLRTGIFNLPFNQYTGIQNFTLDKFSQFLHVVPVILVMTLPCWGSSPGCCCSWSPMHPWRSSGSGVFSCGRMRS